MGNKTNPVIERLQSQQPRKQDVKEAFIVLQSLVTGMGADNALVTYNPDFPDDARDRFAIFLAGVALGKSENKDMGILEAWREVRDYLAWYGNTPESPKRPKQPALLTPASDNESSRQQQSGGSESATPIEPEPPAAASNSNQVLVENLASDVAPITVPTPVTESFTSTADAVEVAKSGIGNTTLPNSTAPITPPTAETKRKYNKRQSLTIAELETAIAALGPEVAKQSRQVANNPEYRANLTEQEIANVKRYWTLAAQLRRRRKAAPQSDQTIQEVAESAIATPIPEQTEVAQPQAQESEVVAAQTDSFFRL